MGEFHHLNTSELLQSAAFSLLTYMIISVEIADKIQRRIQKLDYNNPLFYATQLYLCDDDVQVYVDCVTVVKALMGAGCQHSLEGKAMPSIKDELQPFWQPPNYLQVSFVRIRP